MRKSKSGGNRLLNEPPATPQAETAATSRIGSAAADRDWKAREERYRTEDALSTLTKAEEHRKDPALMRKVAKLAASKAAALKAVTKRK